jgi:hypothetical protein
MRISVSICILVACCGLFPDLLRAQQEPDVDRLVTDFIARGYQAGWWPVEVFGPDGCSPLTGWRERAFQRLADAELSEERSAMLVVSWGAALRLCTNPRLEQWFFGRLARAVNSGEDASLYWRALGRADSPRIRAHLLSMMNDPLVTRTAQDDRGDGLLPAI